MLFYFVIHTQYTHCPWPQSTYTRFCHSPDTFKKRVSKNTFFVLVRVVDELWWVRLNVFVLNMWKEDESFLVIIPFFLFLSLPAWWSWRKTSWNSWWTWCSRWCATASSASPACSAKTSWTRWSRRSCCATLTPSSRSLPEGSLQGTVGVRVLPGSVWALTLHAA